MSELDAVRANRETPASHLANALQTLYLVDPATMSPLQVGEMVDAAIGRLVAVQRDLRALTLHEIPDPYDPAPLPTHSMGPEPVTDRCADCGGFAAGDYICPACQFRRSCEGGET